MYSKIIVLLCIFISSLGFPLAATKTQIFNDVGPYGPNHEAIEYVYSKGIMTGTSEGNFLPYGELTRGQITKIITKTKFSDEQINNCTKKYFSDVDQGNSFFKYICLAKEKGLVNGFSDGKFRSENIVSIEEASKIIVKAYYPDFVATPHEYFGEFYDYLKKLESLGALSFSDGFTGSKQSARRANTAEVIYRLDNNITNRSSAEADQIAYYKMDIEMLPKAQEVENTFRIFSDPDNPNYLPTDNPENIEKIYMMGTIKSGKVLMVDNTINRNKSVVDATNFVIYDMVFKKTNLSICGNPHRTNMIFLQNPINSEIYVYSSIPMEPGNELLPTTHYLGYTYESVPHSIREPINEFVQIGNINHSGFIEEYEYLESNNGYKFDTGSISTMREVRDDLVQIDSLGSLPIYEKTNTKYARYYIPMSGGFVAPVSLISNKSIDLEFSDGKYLEGNSEYTTSVQLRQQKFGQTDLEVFDRDAEVLINFLIFDKSEFDLREIGTYDGQKIYERKFEDYEYHYLFDGNIENLSFEEFKEFHPIVYIEAPNNKVIEFAHSKFLSPTDNC